jgi:hypothetical protein
VKKLFWAESARQCADKAVARKDAIASGLALTEEMLLHRYVLGVTAVLFQALAVVFG